MLIQLREGTSIDKDGVKDKFFLKRSNCHKQLDKRMGPEIN